MKRIIQLIICVLTISLFLGCSSSGINKITRYDIRRSHQMNNIDPGVATEKGNLAVGLNYQYSVVEPEIQEYATVYLDSINDNSNINNTYLYESRHSVSGDLAFTLSNAFAIGMLIDMSVGNIINEEVTDSVKDDLDNNIYEAALFLRIFGQFNNMVLGFRPELLLKSINASKTVYLITDTLSVIDTTISEKSKDHLLSASFRGTFFMRYEFFERFGWFLGFQYKMQPYTIEERSSPRRGDRDKMKFESSYGLYTGFGIEVYPGLHLSPFATFPLGTEITGHQSPIQGGLKVTFDFGEMEKSKKKE